MGVDEAADDTFLKLKATLRPGSATRRSEFCIPQTERFWGRSAEEEMKEDGKLHYGSFVIYITHIINKRK
jgi:hypothetical protein